MKFEKLQVGKTSEIESKITNEWKKVNILEKSIETRKDKPTWVFYDGPIYDSYQVNKTTKKVNFFKDKKKVYTVNFTGY